MRLRPSRRPSAKTDNNFGLNLSAENSVRIEGPIQPSGWVGPIRMKRNSDTAIRRTGEGATWQSLSAAPRLCVSAFILLALVCFLSFALGPVSAHEPITTKVRFNKELIRILQRNCLGCHHTGGIAMSLATYDEARPWAKAIKEELLEKRMPPWHAVRGYGEFRNAPVITQREIDLIVNWVEGGAPKGDDSDLPAGPLFSSDWALGAPDLILRSQTETQVAADADEYRTFSLATDLKEDRWLTAIDLRPGNGSVVHCATISLEGGGTIADPMSQARVASGVRGESIMSSPYSNSKPQTPNLSLATWAPGQRIVALPDGVAQFLPAGSRIAVTVHYRGAGEATKDQSEVGLYFAKTAPRKQVKQIAVSDSDRIIPAGSDLQRVKTSVTIQDDTEAVAIRPRVHPLVASVQATAFRPDGTQEILIWTRGFQFDWQQTYYFKQLVALPKGTRLEVIAYFDNSDSNTKNPNDPAKQVRWSDLSSEPMCALLVTRPRNSE
jgi:mono/diheme cytochrome c family protein